MSVTTLFRPCGIGNYEWLQLDATAPDGAASFSVGDAERLGDEAGSEAMVLIAPADSISMRSAQFDPAEKKLLRQTLPYSLEDELVDDVDELHFALGAIEGDSVDVAIVKRDAIEQWCEALEGQEFDIREVVSELQLLPLEENAWTILVKPDQWLVRYGINRGFAMDAAGAGLALQLLLDEMGEVPGRLLLFAPDQDRAAIQQQLPELLRGVVEWRDEDYWQMVARGFRQGAGRINLFQGEFAPGLPWKKWWKAWKVAAVILVVAVVANILMTFIRIQVLENRNLDLRRETEQVYRSVVPRGAVMDPARQLRRKVEALRTGGGEGFISLFDRVAKVLAAVDGLQLQSVNYNERQSELRLTVLAEQFNDVETVRAKLEAAGLNADLTGSNAEGNKTRARLRVRG